MELPEVAASEVVAREGGAQGVAETAESLAVETQAVE